MEKSLSPRTGRGSVGGPSFSRLNLLRHAVLAICDGKWEDAEATLTRGSLLLRDDAVSLNLLGIVWQARGRWNRARRFYGKAMRINGGYLPADQNMRRVYELDTFGATRLPIALVDRATLNAIRNLPDGSSTQLLDQLDALKSVSPCETEEARIASVKPLDWGGYASAIVTVALATAIGWPLVHSTAHLANVNALMLYLLSVLWVATHHSRGAAVLASALGVATFDFVFVEPYYTFAVADEQYIVTFAVMLLTALVIGTLTHRMRQQSELARQAWERVETEFLRNTLLSGVSHDLRTPLAAITGAAGALTQSGDGLDPATRGEMLHMIASEADRMERLITNLLDMTRLESGGLVLKKEWQHLQEVVGSALHHLNGRLREREIKIDLPPDLPLIQFDAVAIEQVLANLIDNAVEYTPANTAIEISARRGEESVTVEIADHGPGLPQGTETRVFDKFFRADENRRGIGLGLAIARGIVEAHGGSITAANRRGGGATFRFTLPLVGQPDDGPI
jgi:K+-sensing histidine kinase KdpD